MSLGNERRQFTEAIALLTFYAVYYGRHIADQEWFLAVDMAKRCRDCEVGDDDSVHKLGLAEDMNLYINGRYIEDETGHTELHDFWDMLGGAPRIKKDLNHYSFKFQGKW